MNLSRCFLHNGGEWLRAGQELSRLCNDGRHRRFDVSIRLNVSSEANGRLRAVCWTFIPPWRIRIDTSFCAIFFNTTFGGSGMLAKKIVGPLLLALCLSLAGQSTQAQPAQEFQPQVGQEGKDVIWVPTPQELVDKMLDMAKVTPKDFVIDLGSGDG